MEIRSAKFANLLNKKEILVRSFLWASGCWLVGWGDNEQKLILTRFIHNKLTEHRAIAVLFYTKESKERGSATMRDGKRNKEKVAPEKKEKKIRKMLPFRHACILKRILLHVHNCYPSSLEKHVYEMI